jgi:hypothetical protein
VHKPAGHSLISFVRILTSISKVVLKNTISGSSG